VNAEQKPATESEDVILTAVDVEHSIRVAKDEISASSLFRSSRRPQDVGRGKSDAKIGKINGLGMRWAWPYEQYSLTTFSIKGK
jgi:hypothetical protein